MWPVSARFLDALVTPHKLVTTATVTVPGGSPYPLRLKSGSVTIASTARIRRTSDLTFFGTAVEYELISTPGARFDVQNGINFGRDDSELVPVFAGEIVTGAQALGDGTISFSGADLAQRLSGCDFVYPFTVSPTLTRAQAIAAIVLDAMPGTAITTTASDAGLVGTQVWTGARLDAITALCTDGNMDAYFRPDGTFVIVDMPSLTTPPVWTVSPGDFGSMKSASRSRALSKIFNTVSMSPANADGSQPWAMQVAQITDPASPLHPSKIGVRPKGLTSATITDAGSALLAATTYLQLMQGVAETLQLGSIGNPAVEGNDVLRAVAPSINQQPAAIFQHFLDSVQLDLFAGDMTSATRSQVVTDDSSS